MHLDNVSRDRQSESGTAHLTRPRLINAVKALEDLRLRLSRDTETGILYASKVTVTQP